MSAHPGEPVGAEEFKQLNRAVVAEFHANAGKVGGLYATRNLLLLHTTGVKSGLPRLTPLVYFVLDEQMVVIGSYGGAASDPAWVRNLRAQPLVRIEVGTESRNVQAVELLREKRNAAFNQVAALEPGFGRYQAKTRRMIPVFDLQQR